MNTSSSLNYDILELTTPSGDSSASYYQCHKHQMNNSIPQFLSNTVAALTVSKCKSLKIRAHYYARILKGSKATFISNDGLRVFIK